MKHVAIVSAFIIYQEKLLILKRSGNVSTHPNLWAAISGYLENEYPLLQAYTEIREETGITAPEIKLMVQAKPRIVDDIPNQTRWEIHSFLFQARKEIPVRLNWENSSYAWVDIGQLTNYSTVPNLATALDHLLKKSID